MDQCAFSAHHPPMIAKPTQGQILHAWRDHLGWTLERAAAEIADRAERVNIPSNSKSVPRTHASLIRWEKDRVSFNQVGLEVIALAYGATADEIRRMPGKDDEDAAAIAAMLKARRG